MNKNLDRCISLQKAINGKISELDTLKNKAEAEGREPTAEERTIALKLINEAKELQANLQWEKEEANLRDDLNEAFKDPVKPELARDAKMDQIPGLPPKEYRFDSLGDQLIAVTRTDPRHPNYGADRRLNYRATGMNETAPTDGGFLIQTDFSSEIMRNAYARSPLVSRVRRLGLSANSNGIKINAINETSRASSIWGGIIMYWLGEGAAKTASRPELRQMELSLKKIAGLYYATDELLEDASALSSLASEGFSEALDVELERVILRGTGAGQPLGILNSGALISVSQESYQGTGSIVYENLVKMYARMLPSSLGNSAWYISQSCVPELMMMTTSTSPGSGFAGSPVWLQGNNVAEAPYGTILGRPVFPIENASAVGTVGDITFLDANAYMMIDKGGVQMASSIHVNFIYDETCFRIVYRCDGQPRLTSALTPKNSGDTQSPFVALATRT